MPGRRVKNVRKGAHPVGTVFFTVYRREKATGISRKSGMPWKNWAQTRCFGQADLETGKREERWPIALCSAQWVREHFGPGLYRVNYEDGAGQLVGSDDWTIETPPGEVQAAAEPHDSRVRALASRLDGAGSPGGGFELLVLLQDAQDRAADRARREAEIAAQRDRQFFAQLQEQQQNALAQLAQLIQGRAAAAAPSQEMQEREAALTRKELLLTVREELGKVRGDVLAQVQEQIDALSEPDEPESESITEALNSVGVAGVEALGAQLGPVVGDAIGKLRSHLQKKGEDASPKRIAEILAAVQRHVASNGQNGAPVSG